MSGKGGRSVFGSDRCTAGNEAGRYKHGQRVKPDRSHDRLPPPIDRASSAPSTVTVTVRPALRSIPVGTLRSEEHTSELQSLMRISSAVFCLKNNKQYHTIHLCYTH